MTDVIERSPTTRPTPPEEKDIGVVLQICATLGRTYAEKSAGSKDLCGSMEACTPDCPDRTSATI